VCKDSFGGLGVKVTNRMPYVTSIFYAAAGFKLLNIPQVEELFAQRYSTKLRLSTALVTNSALVMSTPTMLVRVLLNLKSIYTGLQQADKVLQITDYLRCDCCCCGIQDVQCSLWAACLSQNRSFWGLRKKLIWSLAALSSCQSLPVALPLLCILCLT
jgi:hypothetical protein